MSRRIWRNFVHRYEQHCPVARAAEVVGGSWTLLVLRELLRGSEYRADIARGVPKMSDRLLGARLRELTDLGVVEEQPGADGQVRYVLTEAGRELRPVVDALGVWGRRWLPAPRLADLDVELLLFDICRQVDEDRLPERPLTVQFDIADAPPPRQWWLTLSSAGAAVRRTAPPVTKASLVRLRCTIGSLAGAWLGRHSWLSAVRERSIVLVGDPAEVRTVIDCVGVSRYGEPA
jgi:DNA-binding HxlR family transcriptional regulator